MQRSGPDCRPSQPFSAWRCGSHSCRAARARGERRRAALCPAVRRASTPSCTSPFRQRSLTMPRRRSPERRRGRSSTNNPSHAQARHGPRRHLPQRRRVSPRPWPLSRRWNFLRRRSSASSSMGRRLFCPSRRSWAYDWIDRLPGLPPKGCQVAGYLISSSTAQSDGSSPNGKSQFTLKN
jgi:hypothetical protein